MKRITMLLGAGILLLCSTVFAAVPQLINFQGILRDGSGNPVANGSYSVLFKIYDAPTAGNVLWSETQSVTTSSGLFNTLLGSVTPIPDTMFNDSSRYLGIKVGADPEMTPRQKLSSVGFSYMSSLWNQRDSIAYRYGKVSLGDFVDANSRLFVQEYGNAPFGKGAIQTIASNSSSGEAYGGIFTANTGGTGYHFGVYGQGYGSSNTYGIYGLGSTFGSGASYGGYFEGTSSGGTSYGISATGGSYGVYATSPTGWGVYASTSVNTAVTGNNISGIGVYGYSSTSNGVYAASSSNTGLYASSGSGYGTYTQGYTNGIVAVASANGGSGVYGSNGGNPSTYAGYFVGTLYTSGDLIAAGSKSATVKVDNGEYRLLYAQESPENWFEDFGSVQLVNGRAVVTIDPLFDQTVNTAVEYHVFLTPRGDCRGLFVANETPTSFEIRELQNGKSDISVSYRIVAKRKGYENVRLVKMTGQTPKEAQANDAKLRAEMAKENAKHQEEQVKMEAERVKMEQERELQEQKLKEHK